MAPLRAHNLSPLYPRKINSPYKGTLSSYGYVLLVIYFLVHVKNPPVLPNLQQMPPMRPISHVRSISYLSVAIRLHPRIGGYSHRRAQHLVHICAHAILRELSDLTFFFRFFDDVELLRQRWQSANNDSVGQLYVSFFHLSDARNARTLPD